MDKPPPMMSTPIKGRYSSFFKELARLPSILFGHYSRDSCDFHTKDTPTKSFLHSLNGSPCRHSPRLLSNGYYTMDEDSFTSEDEGNISFSPTVCRLSYKENMVRIFKRRRRPHAQRALDLSHYDSREDWRASYGEDLTDCDTLDLHQMTSNYAETESMCTTGSITIRPDSPVNVSRILHAEHWDRKDNVQRNPESPWDMRNDKTTSSFADLEDVLEGSSKHFCMPQHTLIGSCTFSDDRGTFILEQKQNLHEGPSTSLRQDGTPEKVAKQQKENLGERPLIHLSQIGSLEEASEDDHGNAEQKKKEKDISIAVLYICVLIFLIFLCARFWTGFFLTTLIAALLTFTATFISIPRSYQDNRLKKKVT